MGYRQNKIKDGTLKVNNSYEAVSLEKKVAALMQAGEPVDGTAPLIYTERKEGVIADYDIRTDRFEVAVEAHGAIAKSNTAKRDMTMGEKAYDGMTKEQQEEFHKKYPHSEKSKMPKSGGGDKNE